MHTSIATVSLSGGLAEKLEAIAAADFTGVEIFESDLLSFNGSPAEVARMASDLGLRIITFQPFRDFEGMPEPQRGRTFERAERKFDLMGELGCNLLMICSNVSPASLGGVDRAAADFHSLGERAANRGIRIGFEALAWGRHISDYRDSWEVVRRAQHPAIGLTLDSFHIFSRRSDLEAIRAIPGDKIALVQLADAPWLNMDVINWSRHFRCFPGQGEFPLTDFMDAVFATGYDGPLSLEIFNDQFRAGWPRSIAVDGQRSVLYLMDQMRGRSGAFAKAAPPMPPRARCLGIEFLEFAADDRPAAELAKLFSGLGFRKISEHKSKAVTRWSQGGINLLLNSDKEGFAHSHQLLHGPSVCAMCLKVEAAADTLDRAEKLLDAPFRQAVGPGELEIPAVRGLGGSLLYFIDPKTQLGRLWDIDFVAPRGSTNAIHNGAGLITIDHVSQSMLYEEMLSWLLFYSSLLDTSKTPQLDVIDPSGIVRSQVVQTADGALRIALNASQSQRTLSSQFLSNYLGSGMQHIAFTTRDIVTTVQQLRASGVDLLAIPENYYDDLGTRTDIPSAQIDTMRRHNILYDRDDAGEYLQVYTRAFENLFFFEIVERRGYQGFGAVNAPIRLAAQARESTRQSSHD
jgi:4-hydroxyphenylpyruvate dioxygenase